MKVVFLKPVFFNRDKPELHLEPESGGDNETLERLVATGFISGFGRDAETSRILHVQIPLYPREKLWPSSNEKNSGACSAQPGSSTPTHDS